MEENNQQTVETKEESTQIEPIIRKFELAIFNENIRDDGSIELKQERMDQPLIVGVKFEKELMAKLNLYKSCGQVAKIVREIDPPPADKLKMYDLIFRGNRPVTTKQLSQNQPELTQHDASKQNVKIISNTFVKQKPKYYKIGDIEIKDDNGKIYQKQWMKLTDTEASNFRLVNDKNNAIANMNGKHLEMKKWILVQNSEEDECTQLEENIK